MSKITYADKVALNTNTEIPAQNKVEDTDMNNIKGAINQIGSFFSLTAGSNGDFYCALKGNLSANDIVTISFPTATNGASNARLSIDGGITYKNIVRQEDSNNVLAKYIQNNRIKLYYDGTNFIFFETITKRIYNGNARSGSLSESIDNFKHIKILYKNNDNYCNSCEITPNGGSIYVALGADNPTSSGPAVYLKSAILTLSGTSFSIGNDVQWFSGTTYAGKYFTITEIIGTR